MEFVYLYSASHDDYSEILSHYETRELTKEEKKAGIFGECVINFSSLEELMHFEKEVGDIIICERCKQDNTYYKTIIIYDWYIE